jgi:hypothetical protein
MRACSGNSADTAIRGWMLSSKLAILRDCFYVFWFNVLSLTMLGDVSTLVVIYSCWCNE